MKKVMLIVLMLTLVSCNPVFAGSNHHNTTNQGGNSSASAGALGVGIGLSKNKNTNKNTVVGRNKNLNANFNTNDIDIKNKIKNDITVKNNVDVDTTDINVNILKNKQKQDQAQLQGQLQGQAQDASNTQGQTTDVIIEDNSITEGSIAWTQGSLTVEKGVNSFGVVHPLFGGVQAGTTEEYAKIMENINATIHLYEKELLSEDVAKARIGGLLKKLDGKTLCTKKFLGIIKFGNPILDLLSFDVCQEL